MTTRKPKFSAGETVVWAATSERPDVEILEGPFRVERSDYHGGWMQWNMDNPYVYLVQPPNGTALLVGEVALKEKVTKKTYTFTRYYQVIAESEDEARGMPPEIGDFVGSAWALTSVVENRE